MPRLETSGMRSCAVCSISGFEGAIKANKQWKKEKKTPSSSDYGYVGYWFNNGLITVSQEYGESDDYIFTQLMQCIDAHEYGRGKVLMVTLSKTQYLQQDKYWHKELKRWGFRLKVKTQNLNGEDNYIYMRVPKSIPLNGDQR
jgi:hypothetical protein